MAEELEILRQEAESGWDDLLEAAGSARDQGRFTWLTENGRRVAAIVPVDVAEHEEQRRAGAAGTTTARPGSQVASDAYRARRNHLRRPK